MPHLSINASLLYLYIPACNPATSLQNFSLVTSHCNTVYIPSSLLKWHFYFCNYFIKVMLAKVVMKTKKNIGTTDISLINRSYSLSLYLSLPLSLCLSLTRACGRSGQLVTPGVMMPPAATLQVKYSCRLSLALAFLPVFPQSPEA